MTDTEVIRSKEPKTRKRNSRQIVQMALNGIQALATLGALIFAIISLNATNKLQRDLVRDQIVLQRRIAANEVWTSYIEWSYKNTEFPNMKFEFDANGEPKNEKFVWFMERLLSAAEEILNAYPNDLRWEDTFVYEFQYYQSYFLSDYFLKDNVRNGVKTMSFYCTYDAPVRRAVQRAFSNHPEAGDEVIAAEKACLATPAVRSKVNA